MPSVSTIENMTAASRKEKDASGTSKGHKGSIVIGASLGLGNFGKSPAKRFIGYFVSRISRLGTSARRLLPRKSSAPMCKTSSKNFRGVTYHFVNGSNATFLPLSVIFDLVEDVLHILKEIIEHPIITGFETEITDPVLKAEVYN